MISDSDIADCNNPFNGKAYNIPGNVLNAPIDWAVLFQIGAMNDNGGYKMLPHKYNVNPYYSYKWLSDNRKALNEQEKSELEEYESYMIWHEYLENLVCDIFIMVAGIGCIVAVFISKMY